MTRAALCDQGLALGATADCTVALLDQRDWGGCVDVPQHSYLVITPLAAWCPSSARASSARAWRLWATRHP